MALEQGKDYIINIDAPKEELFVNLANNHNVGMLALGTPNYFFMIDIFDVKSTFSTEYSYSNEQSYFVQTNTYYTKHIADKTLPQALTEVLTSQESTVEDVEKFVLALMTEKPDGDQKEIVGGEIINIHKCKKFIVKKMWIGGGSITYKYPEHKVQKQIPIVKAADAKMIKAYYLNSMFK